MLINNWISGDHVSSEDAVGKIEAFARNRLVGLVNCAGGRTVQETTETNGLLQDCTGRNNCPHLVAPYVV